MIYKLLVLQIIVVLSFFATISVGAPYHDIYGNKVEKIEKFKDKIILLYFDIADKDTETTVSIRLKHLAEAFEQWQAICIIVVTQETSLLDDLIPHLLAGNQDIYVNKSDELWKQYHPGRIPAAMIDLNPNPSGYVEHVTDDKDSETFLSNLKEKIQAAIRNRITELIHEGDKWVEKKEYTQARACYAEAAAWVERVSNLHIFTPQELAGYYIQLANGHVNIVGDGITQSNPEIWDAIKASMEKRDLETAAECLKKAISLNPNLDESKIYAGSVDEREQLEDAGNSYLNAFYTGLVCESQGKLEDARNSYHALSQKSDWAEVKMSLERVKEKMRRIWLCIQQEIVFYDGLPETKEENFPNWFERILIEELINRGYKVWIIYSINQNNGTLMGGKILYGKAILTIRKFRPESVKQIVAEGSVQIDAVHLDNTGTIETIADLTLDRLERGFGVTDFKAIEDFFNTNGDLFTSKINQFFSKH
ncbi:hypothetical protein HYR99_36495 [Candidatus Poribacteria bacterium]|nr:hypothetical protein [Candidatus Poribacteria bacterium]